MAKLISLSLDDYWKKVLLTTFYNQGFDLKEKNADELFDIRVRLEIEGVTEAKPRVQYKRY